jgi:exodeoxyribonuclease I
MAKSFFFYDLETSGFNPKTARIMQFAGQRTDMELKAVGEPVNVLIKLTPEILPEPDAILVTGITPQATLQDGVTEAEFLKLFHEQVATPDTIFVGFNSVRFDDEFMRYLQYRNFYDAYEWQWQDGRSRWDLLDVVRMTRALRPDGIKWPFASDGQPTNRLEFLTAVNKLDHSNAHDALSDVLATIAVTRLIKTKQPKLFDFLLTMRDKRTVAKLVTSGEPFVYTSGKYPSEFEKTTVATMLMEHPHTQGAALVYDLRQDPTPFLKMDVAALLQAWRWTKDPEAVRLPVKTLKYNRCPAVAPLGVAGDTATQQRLGLTLEAIGKHRALLRQHQAAFTDKLRQALDQLDAEQVKRQASLVDNQLTVDARLYDGFISPADKPVMSAARAAKPAELDEGLASSFKDERLKSLLPLYKARNYPLALDADERLAWEAFCRQQLFEGGPASRLAKYFKRLEELAAGKLTDNQQYLLEELRLYGQSIMPAELD